jgi:polyferredoxin
VLFEARKWYDDATRAIRASNALGKDALSSMSAVQERPSSLFESAPPHLRPLISAGGKLKEMRVGDSVVSATGYDSTVLCVISGAVQVTAPADDLDEMARETLEPGEFFGDIAFLTGRSPAPHAQLVAVKPSVILEISLDQFQRVLRENPDFTSALLRSLAKRVEGVGRSVFVCRFRPEAAGEDSRLSGMLLSNDYEARLRNLAASGTSALLVGEAGVGKELIAYAVFELSASFNEVFVPVDLIRMKTQASFFRISDSREESLESGIGQSGLLFGFQSSGAGEPERITAGYLDLCKGGTLFIRGADILTAACQQKLLDALKTGAYCAVGSSTVFRTSFRLICSTELELGALDPDRHPLLYELRDSAVSLPPLRDRRSEIVATANHYLSQHARELCKGAPRIPTRTMKALIEYSWPGNDLELSEMMKRALLCSPGDVIRPEDLSFASERDKRRRGLNLLSFRPIRQALKSPLYPALLQSAFVPVFLATLLMLFFGPQESGANLAAVAAWALAWPGMILSAFAGGRIWCSVCAIGALSKLAKRITAREIPFPNRLKLRSDFLIAGGVLFIIWVETAVDIRSHPYVLGLLLLSMFVLAFILNTLYARQAWCRYLCPLGGMTGLLARISIVELRADTRVCLARCVSHDCYYGDPETEGCPFGQVAATLHSNHYCKICGNCVKTCRHDAIRLQFRAPGRELWETTHVRTGTGFLVLGLLGGLLSDMAVKTQYYAVMRQHLDTPHIVLFSGVFFTAIAAVHLPVIAASALSQRSLQDTFAGAYARFSLGLLPLVCCGFLAFHLYYLVHLGGQALRSVGATGPAAGIVSAIPDLPASAVLAAQQALVIIGLLWTAFTYYKIAGQAPRTKGAPVIVLLPHILSASALAALLIIMLRLTFSGGG